MNWITLIGLLAATLTTISFLPQVIKSWKSKQTKDLSLPMYILVTIGIFLWFSYGFLTKDLPVTLGNGISFALVLFVLIAKLKYG